MSVPYRTPTGVKVICLAAAVDALMNIWEGWSLLVGGDPVIPWPLAIALGVLTIGQALWQLGAVYGLYMLKPSAYRWAIGALQAGILFDLIGLFVGVSSPLDLGLTIAAILYLYARRDTFVPPGHR